MKINLAALPQDEMDKVNVDPLPQVSRLKSVTTCQSWLRWWNVSNPPICVTGSASV